MSADRQASVGAHTWNATYAPAAERAFEEKAGESLKNETLRYALEG